MNPRLTKELRPLLLPWVLAAAAAVGHLVARPDSAYFSGAFGDFITGLAGVAFVLGVLVLAAMPAGTELHERTLTLLLTQPMERARLWREKLIAASLMIATLGIVHGVAVAVMGRLNLHMALVCAAFAITAICSVGYHTLATRSVLVGIATAIGLPYAVTLSTHLIAYYLFGLELHLSEAETLTLIIAASLVYSAFCLQISRRQFVTLELRDAVASRAAEVPTALVPVALSNLFRPRPTGVILNLIRKEVCLHKPLFLVSAIFTVAWVLTLLLMVLRPAWHDGCVATLHGLTGTQVVLMVILGGCTALGDDKALGTLTWHLSLPVSARRQWLIKLLSALGTTFALAVILPVLLAVLTLFKARVGLLAAPELFAPAIPCLVVFVISFWSASMMPNTVRAALTCILTLFCMFAIAGVGASLSELIFKPWALQSVLVSNLLQAFQISSSELAKHPAVTAYPILFVCLIGGSVALMQSYSMFRGGQVRRFSRIKYAIVLMLIVLLGAFWCADLNRALFIHRQQTMHL